MRKHAHLSLQLYYNKIRLSRPMSPPKQQQQAEPTLDHPRVKETDEEKTKSL